MFVVGAVLGLLTLPPAAAVVVVAAAVEVVVVLVVVVMVAVVAPGSEPASQAAGGMALDTWASVCSPVSLLSALGGDGGDTVGVVVCSGCFR